MALNNIFNGGATPLNPAFGGTGVDNNPYTLTVTSNSFIDQDVRTSSSPTFSDSVTATNFLAGYTTTVTTGGTTTLTATSDYQQYFTGGAQETVVLPDVTMNMKLGQSFLVVNNSADIVSVDTPTSVRLEVLNPNTQATFTCIKLTGNDATSWSITFSSDLIGQYLNSQILAINAVTLTLANTAYDLTSIILPIGDWDVWGSITWINGLTSGGTAQSYGWLNNVSGTMIDLSLTNQFSLDATQNYVTMSLSPRRFITSRPEQIYISAQASTTVRTICGFIAARRWG